MKQHDIIFHYFVLEKHNYVESRILTSLKVDGNNNLRSVCWCITLTDFFCEYNCTFPDLSCRRYDLSEANNLD